MQTIVTARPEFKLALNIAGTIMSVLVVVVFVAFSFAFVTDATRQQDMFRTREEMIRTRPGFIENLKSNMSLPMQERRPVRWFMASMFRNIIVVSMDGHIDVLGPLENVELTKNILEGLPMNRLKERSIWGEDYTLYAFSFDTKTVVLYEPSELLKWPRAIVLGSTAWGIVLFSVLIFFVSLRIARRVITPIEELAERERAYARHIAHELKTPLSVIKSDLELASMMPEESKERIASVMGEISAMWSIVDDLMVLSVGDAWLIKTQVDIARMMQDFIGKGNNTRISWRILWEENACVQADERLLRMLIKNLVNNVYVHAVPDTEAIVRFDSDGFSFENSAPNIPDTLKKSVFDPFVGTPGKGSGIGLSLVKRIVELHGWTTSFKVENGRAQICVWY